LPLIFPSNTLSAAGFSVDNSCRFNDGDGAYMHKALSTPTSTKIGTLSTWFKRAQLDQEMNLLGAETDNNSRGYLQLDDGTNGTLHFWWEEGSTVTSLKTNRLFRDVSAWYHVVVAYDTSQSTDTDRIKIYINGTQETSFATSTYPPQDATTCPWNISGYNCSVGSQRGGGGSYGSFFDGYQAETVFIDGQQLAPTEFGEFNEDSSTIWQPIDVSGLTFGNNGYYLDYEDSANLGNDANGGTDFTEVNLAATDQATDSPSNNFATYNPLINTQNIPTFSEGNTQAATTSSGVNGGFSSIGVANGKWYVEFKLSAHSGTNRCILGVTSDPAEDDRNNEYLGQTARSYSYSAELGKKVNNNTASTYGDSYTTDDILGVALDLTNLKLYFSKNGTWQDSGDPTSGATGTGAAFTVTAPASTDTGFYFFAEGDESGSHSVTVQANFGNPAYAITSSNADGNGYGNFEYAVPSGYYALNTKNLAEFG
jgi:hypothetical protein